MRAYLHTHLHVYSQMRGLTHRVLFIAHSALKYQTGMIKWSDNPNYERISLSADFRPGKASAFPRLRKYMRELGKMLELFKELPAIIRGWSARNSAAALFPCLPGVSSARVERAIVSRSRGGNVSTKLAI